MPTSLRCAPEIEERYARLAAATNRTKSFYFNRALEEAIDQLEYEYGLLKDVEDFRAGNLETFTLSEVKEHYDLDD